MSGVCNFITGGKVFVRNQLFPWLGIQHFNFKVNFQFPRRKVYLELPRGGVVLWYHLGLGIYGP
jgi:hypothetical protein